MNRLIETEKRIRFESTGDPPNEYLVTYACYGLLDMGADAEPKEGYTFRVKFTLPQEYPNAPPIVMGLQSVFHPNISGNTICFGGRHWRGGEKLANLVLRIGRMIQYESVNEDDAYNTRSL